MAKKKIYNVEKVVTLNSFDTKKEAEIWMERIKKLNDDKEVRFQLTPTP